MAETVRIPAFAEMTKVKTYLYKPMKGEGWDSGVVGV